MKSQSTESSDLPVRSSSPESRIRTEVAFSQAIDRMLIEKEKQYGVHGGFYENNAHGKYDHALGELRLKLREYERTGNIRMLIKAATWIYLIYEMENVCATH